MSASDRPDVNFNSIYAEHGQQIDGMDLSKVDGSQYSSPLKISHSFAIVGSHLVIPQGLENAVDIDLCDGVHLSGEFGTGPVQGDQVITVKGGTKNYTLEGTLHSRGNRGYEVGVGNWFDQSYGIGGKGLIDLNHQDGGKVRVAIGWAIPFATKLGNNCKYMPFESLKLKAYFIIKFLVRFALRIPIGTKGPSWL